MRAWGDDIDGYAFVENAADGRWLAAFLGALLAMLAVVGLVAIAFGCR